MFSQIKLMFSFSSSSYFMDPNFCINVLFFAGSINWHPKQYASVLVHSKGI